MQKPKLYCLILLISFPSVATVLISPGLPSIGWFFGISPGYTQQLVTIFVLGYALGQLIYSPFANRFGRKVAMYMGVGLYLVSVALCLLAIAIHNYQLLLVARLLMALGSAAGMIISFTIVNDIYVANEARKITSFVVLAYAFMPALAVAVGGYITTHLRWIDCFYFYGLYGIFMLWVTSRLPETLITEKKQALQLKLIAKNYLKAFSTVRLVSFSLIYGLMSAYIYIIASSGPFIAIHDIGMTASTYGLLLLIPYCGQFIGAYSSGKLSQRLSAFQLLSLGYTGVAVGTFSLFIAFYLHYLTVVSLIIPLFFIMLSLPMTYGASTVMALTNYDDKATGSAIMSFITMFVTLMFVLALTLLPEHNPLIMPILFICVFVCACLVLIFVKMRWG